MKTTMTIRSIFLAAILAVPSSIYAESVDWPQWRGPQQDLKSLQDGVFGGSFGLEVDWQKTLGSGYSSISVVGHRAVTMYSDGENDVLVALDVKTGEELWSYAIAPTYKGHSGSDDGPLGTPTIHDGVVYVLGPKGHLVAVGLEDGKKVWSHKIDEQFAAVPPEYGFTTVPVVSGGLVIVQTGGADGRCVSAFDPKTGEMRWSYGNDPVGYHSPLNVELLGKKQILAISNQHVLGILPATGEVLWKHRYTEDENWGAQPVAIEGDRILISFGRESALYQFKQTEDGYALEELWRNNNLRNSNAVPVYHEGHFYGFSGRFFVCVDAATGEVAWKSRPPGFGGVVLVDGHLVTYAGEGEVVVAEANPEEYVEKARLKLADRLSFTPPSFASDRLFVRDLTQVASIRITDAAVAPVVADQVPLEGRFGDFVRALQSAPDKAAMLDRFMAEQKSFPMVEGEDLVHFVYRGDADDMAISGNHLPFGGEQALYRVEGTDLWFRSYRLSPKALFEYSFHQFDERMTDPLNPVTLGPEGQSTSLLAMPGWTAPEHIDEPTGQRGTLEKFNWKSEVLGNEREMTIWLPPGYAASGKKYPLAVVNYGNLALSHGLMANSLDNLVGKSVAPVVVAFLPRVDFNEYANQAEDWSKALAEELMPHLEKKYRLLDGAENRAMTGIASGAFGSTYFALRYPGSIGKVATQSFYYRTEVLEEWQKLLEADDARTLAFYIEWSENDYDAQGVSSKTDSPALAKLLDEKGYDVTTHTGIDGAGWGGWRARTDRIFETFFPLDP